MADIVIGIASSHTPQLSSGVDMWPDHALRDQRYPLLGKDASFHTYEETLAGADPRDGRGAQARGLGGQVPAGAGGDRVARRRAQGGRRGPGARHRRRPAGAVRRRRHPRVRLLHRDRALRHGARRGDLRQAAEGDPGGLLGGARRGEGRPPGRHGAERAHRRAAGPGRLRPDRVHEAAGRADPGARVHLPQVPARAAGDHADRAGLRQHLLPAERAVRRALPRPGQGTAPGGRELGVRRAGRRDRLGRADPLRHRRDARPRCPRRDRRQGRGRARRHPPRQAPLGELGDPQLGHRRRGARRPLGDHRRLRSRLPDPGGHRHRHGLRPLGTSTPTPRPRSSPPSCEVAQR